MSEDVRGKAMPSGKNESIAKKSYCCCEDSNACDQKWQCLRLKRQHLLLFGRCLQISYVLPLRDEGNAFCFEKVNNPSGFVKEELQEIHLQDKARPPSTLPTKTAIESSSGLAIESSYTAREDTR